MDIPDEVSVKLNIDKENISQVAESELLNPISIIGSKISSLGSIKSTPTITPYKMLSYEWSEANGSRLGIAKMDNGRLEAKIKEIEDQLEETRWRKAEPVPDVVDRSDNVTPQECTFDDILKNLNIEIACSNPAESVYSRGAANRKWKEWSKRPSW